MAGDEARLTSDEWKTIRNLVRKELRKLERHRDSLVEKFGPTADTSIQVHRIKQLKAIEGKLP